MLEQRPDPTTTDLKSFSDVDLRHVFFRWAKPTAALRADMKIARGETISLKETRLARLVSTNEIARRLDVDKKTYLRFEKNPDSLEFLMKACRALECEMKIQITPQSSSFLLHIWNPLFKTAVVWPAVQREIGSYRAVYMLAARMDRLFRNAKFRRLQGWNRQREETYISSTVPSENRPPEGLAGAVSN